MKSLILTRHFPPIVSGGARRPYLFAKELTAAGADVRVVAPALPDDIEGIVVPHPAPAPADNSDTAARSLDRFAIAAKDWARATLLLPDPDIRWTRRAVRAARTLASFGPDWILSTSPPESIHFGAARLARQFGCRWAADFRDGWLTYPLLPQRNRPLRRRAERWLAQRVMKRADLLTAPESFMLEEVRTYAPRAASLLAPQAFYPTDRATFLNPRPGNDTITIAHVGSFSFSHDKRRIEPALDLFARARSIDPRFRLSLVGRLTAEERTKAAATDGVELSGVLGLEDAAVALCNADILLLVAAPETEIPPGKIAEYRAAGRPFVCLGGGAWKSAIPGGEDDPLALLLSLRDPAQRRALAQAQGEQARPASKIAQMVFHAMEEVARKGRPASN